MQCRLGSDSVLSLTKPLTVPVIDFGKSVTIQENFLKPQNFSMALLTALKISIFNCAVQGTLLTTL